MESVYQVRVEGIRFDAAHFATFGGECEPLHGHSYEVAVEVEGALGEDGWVIDFRELRHILRRIVSGLDHRFLLQRKSRLIEIEEGSPNWAIRTPTGLSYAFPASDVVALPIDNSTAERLAEWFTGRVWEEIKARNAQNVAAIAIEVSEGPAQKATYRRICLPDS